MSATFRPSGTILYLWILSFICVFHVFYVRLVCVLCVLCAHGPSAWNKTDDDDDDDDIPVVINDHLPGRSVISKPDPPHADAAIETDSLAVRPATTPDRNLSSAPYCK